MKHLLAILLLGSVVMTGCTKLTWVNSAREKEGISLFEHAHYDAESKIRYMVSNNDSLVFLRFDTDNPSTIMRIRNHGAIVRFDVNGRKKGGHSLRYPVYTNLSPDQGVNADPSASGASIRANLFPPATTAVWTVGEQNTNVDLGLNEQGFVAKAALDDKNVLEYLVGVPFKLLGGSRPDDFANLNMALEIPAPPSANKNSGSTTDPSMSMPGSMNNGINGGMNPNSMSGPLPQGGMMSSGGVSGGPGPIRIWMEVKLSRSSGN
ncbi:MAG: hypothetical protein U0176_16570 [Bacteroidia bacterium]